MVIGIDLRADSNSPDYNSEYTETLNDILSALKT